jgi:transcriptional regulator with XRE-family HTH domain
MTRWRLVADTLEFQKHRIDKGMTQADLAEQIGYSVSYVSQVERGLRHPGPRFIKTLCDVLQQPRTVLFLSSEDLNGKNLEEQAQNQKGNSDD